MEIANIRSFISDCGLLGRLMYLLSIFSIANIATLTMSMTGVN